MFEYRNLWHSVLRSVAAASLILLLAVGLGGLTAAPVAAQASATGSVTARSGSDTTTVTSTVDEWENDILNGGGGSPATSLGLMHEVVNLFDRALDWVGGLMGVAQGPSK